jgi:hypothetical protein
VPGSARLLFSSGFEGLTAVTPPFGFWGTGAWQSIAGADTTTGFTWSSNMIWGGGQKFQLLLYTPVDATTIDNYFVNRIETVTGHAGNQTRALYSEIKQSGGGGTPAPPQDTFMFVPASEQGDMYISFWMKLQANLVQNMTPQNWRSLFEWKTNGDYRISVYAASWDNGCNGLKRMGPVYWQIRGDNEANGGLPYQEFWRVENCAIAVPVDQWFKLEVFWHRSSGADGRAWVAVNGQVIADHRGSLMGVRNAPINRIMPGLLYSQTPLPIYQWIDDLEIWDGFPVVGNNPPYAPH